MENDDKWIYPDHVSFDYRPINHKGLPIPTWDNACAIVTEMTNSGTYKFASDKPPPTGSALNPSTKIVRVLTS